MASIYEAAGGEHAFVALAHAWHARCLADPVMSHAFSHGYHREHCERLAAYWAEALGGPTVYSDSLGDETEVIRIHSCSGEHVEMDELAEACFALALDDATLPDDPRLRSTLTNYFHWANQTMSAHSHSTNDLADGLVVAKWSWDGPL